MDGEIRALIDENSADNDVIIYTDGSVIRHQRCSWAFSARSSGKTVKEASGAFATTTSSLTMEVRAVTEAWLWLTSQDYAHACILSDSMSMLRKVEAGKVRRKWVDLLMQSKTQKIVFIFVPGHAGVKGNERADKLAGMATLSEGVSMDRADIINALSDSARLKDLQENKSQSLSRLREMGVKIGTARNEKFNKYTKRLINQHRIGTVSRYTLRDLLRRGSEHLWTCPMCVK